MSMDSKESRFGLERLRKSFGYAWQGIRFVWSSEQNFRIHAAAGFIAAALGVLLSISVFEWIVLILLISGMMALETMNTAIEKAVDLVSPDDHPLAKASKDAAAAAVLLFAIGSFIIGCIIFIPKIFNY
ncbi:diacylglycerol kinase family protein [Bacillus sp. Marseille-Q1617]|uniref:diacylglycerol kinase family protein n=1 Tax=Bacillus sp. Marseille-Q1617 TaxID=2736887 RepID=UPI0020CA8A5E|nr:diacylglycerol kinase family protein [Bacillus sp. Marseille-Q1617]